MQPEDMRRRATLAGVAKEVIDSAQQRTAASVKVLQSCPLWPALDQMRGLGGQPKGFQGMQALMMGQLGKWVLV